MSMGLPPDRLPPQTARRTPLVSFPSLPPPALHRLPVEIVQRIAVFVFSLSPADEGPRALVRFMVTNKAICAMIHRSDIFYCDLFKHLFDYQAIERRFKDYQHHHLDTSETGQSSSSSGSSSCSDSPAPFPAFHPFSQHDRHLGSTAIFGREYAKEFFVRMSLFRRIRAYSTHSETQNVSTGHHAPEHIRNDLLQLYLMVCENDGKNLNQLIHHAQIARFLNSYRESEIDPINLEDEFPPASPEIAIFMFLEHQFLDLYQPVTSHQLSKQLDSRLRLLKNYMFAPNLYDVAYAPWTCRNLPIRQPASRSITPPHLPQLPRLSVTSPFGQHLGRPVSRTVTPITDSEPDVWFPPTISGSESDPVAPATDLCELVYFGKRLKILAPLHSHVATRTALWLFAHNSSVSTNPLYSPRYVDRASEIGFIKMLERAGKTSSEDYDDVFYRATRCIDVYRSMGLAFDFFLKKYEGSWEGKFTWIDVHASQAIVLRHSTRAIPEAGYGDQKQVFKDLKEYIVRLSDERPVRFNDEARVAQSQIGSRENEEENETRYLNKIRPITADEDVPFVAFDPKESYEIQIHGTGSSAWGTFLLKGRIRSWDGMITFIKVYNQPKHGKWIYQGYSHPGGLISSVNLSFFLCAHS